MSKGYQTNYSTIQKNAVHNIHSRNRKATTIHAILANYLQKDTRTLKLLDVGASTGIIDFHLASHFHEVFGIDIDINAIEHASKAYSADNLHFMVGDALNIQFQDDSIDIVLCSHVYEHVPDQGQLMREIFRVLKPGGICYFSAGNRLNIMEPHYKLPFLSVLPRFIAHLYLRLSGRGKFYYEEHKTYWNLKKLVKDFKIHDYTTEIINNPEKYAADYMLPPGSKKQKIAKFIASHVYWLMPGYIWILLKE